MKKKDLLKLLLLVSILTIFDMLTKYFFYNLEFLSSLEIIKPIINTGVSFSIKLPLIIIIIISILALVLFLGLFYKKNINRLIAGFLIAGTLGNLIDRIVLGGVRDFIALGKFPIFNLADSLLNIGILLFFVQEFFKGQKRKEYIN